MYNFIINHEKSSSLTISPKSLIKTHYRIVTETEILQYVLGAFTDVEGFAYSKCPCTETVISA